MKNFIPADGGYEKLLSFQKARIVYDGTVWFCKHFLEKRDRTYDQMVQAARSGKQNILEGSQASGTFNEPEAFDDIAKQFILMETHSRDAKTGLLYHGWYESKKQRWADPTTRRSPNLWGRALGGE